MLIYLCVCETTYNVAPTNPFPSPPPHYHFIFQKIDEENENKKSASITGKYRQFSHTTHTWVAVLVYVHDQRHSIHGLHCPMCLSVECDLAAISRGSNNHIAAYPLVHVYTASPPPLALGSYILCCIIEHLLT